MARFLVMIAAAVAVFIVLWLLLWAFLHTLIFGFWILLAVLVGFGVFRIGRWSRRGSRSRL